MKAAESEKKKQIQRNYQQQQIMDEPQLGEMKLWDEYENKLTSKPSLRVEPQINKSNTGYNSNKKINMSR